MIYDLLSSLKRMGDPSELAAASYSLKEGLYILFDGDSHEEILIQKDGGNTGELFELVRAMDFYSLLVEMNKPVDPQKKIHSNNIYSISFKYYDPKKGKSGEESKNVNIYDFPSLEEHINRYFDALGNWYDNYKNIFKTLPVKPTDKEAVKLNKHKFLDSIPTVIELVKKYDLKPGKYLKMFIKASIEDYKTANDLYLIPKIFNNNDDNLVINGEIFGLSNENMGVNSKKPFLEHKTTPYSVPYRITFNQALDAHQLMLWLNSQSKDGKPINAGYLLDGSSDAITLQEKISGNTSAHFVHLKRGKTFEVDDYEMLPQAKEYLTRPFKRKNYLQLTNYDNKSITDMMSFETVVDNVLFNGCLVKNYYYEPKANSKILTARQASLIQISKNAFISYFRKSDDTAIKPIIDKVSLGMILEKLKQPEPNNVNLTLFARALNLRFALLEYFEVGGKEKLGSEVRDGYQELKDKVLQDKPEGPVVCSSDQEFYFAVGQLARYLIGLSKAQNMTYNSVSPILRAKDSNKIKREISALIGKYGHEINVFEGKNRSRFDNLLSIVNSHKDDTQPIMTDLILAGFASPSIIYYKKNEEEEK
ncbi:MAG TPA: hypothetical protein DD738_11335 [Ruminiclostridium sp.]|nr:hypothetical protein [Ruminiclostridium sp.]